MANMAIRQVVNIAHHAKISPPGFTKPKSVPTSTPGNRVQFLSLHKLSSKTKLVAASKASPPTGSISEDGVSLGTMKLPSDTNVARFETLLFQWGNSLCQGANLPLPVPLKIDKIPGGARLGFITVGDNESEVLVYIDCLVFPGSEISSPMFRAVRNGPKKDQPTPGEPRIMRGLLESLKKCGQITRI